MAAPSRPLLRWHGGKWVAAPWIIAHFPPHRVYVEPFGGAASVLLRKPRSYAEVYNDLDQEVVALLRVLRGPDAPELIRRLRLTPFARAEFDDAYAPGGDDLETARRLVVRSFMGFGSTSALGRKPGFRADSNRSGTPPARDWTNYPDALQAIVERLAGVVVENRPALEVMAAFDRPDALHYVDPPYMPETRGGAGKAVKHVYRHEMTVEDHERLLQALQQLAGFVVVSGYATPLYDHALAGWLRVARPARADGARLREEILWINPRCTAALAACGGVQYDMTFAEAV